MTTPKPILDYAPTPRLLKTRKYLRRALWSLLILVLLIASPIAWLYWDWHSENSAVLQIEKNHGLIMVSRPLEIPLLTSFLRSHDIGRYWILYRPLNVAFHSDTDLPCLRRLHHVETVSFGYYGQPATFTDAGLVHLQGLSLVDLYLNDTATTDAGLAHLTKMKYLENLGLNRTRVSDAGLAYLVEIPGLSQVGLDGTAITDAGLVHLGRIRKLNSICLFNTPITDAGLAHLKNLPNLQTLLLSNTRITDAGLVHLQTMTGLRDLQIFNNQVTDNAVAQLQKTLPKCLIGWTKQTDMQRPSPSDNARSSQKNLTSGGKD